MRQFIDLVEQSEEPWLDHTDDEVPNQLWLPKHGIDNFVRAEFSAGYCAYLARALHEVTGWPVMAELDSRGLGHIEHVWVVNHQGKAVDINGVHPSDYARTKYSEPTPGKIIQVPNIERQAPEDDYGVLDWARQLVELFPKHFGI